MRISPGRVCGALARSAATESRLIPVGISLGRVCGALARSAATDSASILNGGHPLGHLIRVYMSVVLPLASRRPIGASNGSPMTVHTDQEVGIPRLVHTLPEVRQVETEIAILSVKSTGPAVAAMGSRTLGGIPWCRCCNGIQWFAVSLSQNWGV